MMMCRNSVAGICVVIALSFANAGYVLAQGQPPKARPARLPDRIKEGDPAPLFVLKSIDGKQAFDLADYRDKKPVALVFGSYT